MPNQEATPRRTIRVPEDVWDGVKRVAADRNETVTDVVNRALRRYLREFGEDDR